MTGLVEGRRWVLEIPAPGAWKPVVSKTKRMPAAGWPLRADPKWLTMNKRMHWRPKDRLKTEWRAAATEAARVALGSDGRRRPLPVGEVKRARIDAVFHFPTHGARRDIINWHETTKVVIDALTSGNAAHPGYGFLPDDQPDRYLHCPDCPHLREHPDKLVTKAPYGPVGLLVMTLTELIEEAS